HITFLFFALTALSGLIMRIMIISPDLPLTFSNILHGHSHIGILGWTFLGVFIVFLSLTWDEIEKKKQAIAIIIATLFITLGMFIAFLIQGYALYSII